MSWRSSLCKPPLRCQLDGPLHGDHIRPSKLKNSICCCSCNHSVDSPQCTDTHAVWQDMTRREQYGHIINISSMSAHRVPNGSSGGTFYAATKHALRAITEGLRQEVSPTTFPCIASSYPCVSASLALTRSSPFGWTLPGIGWSLSLPR